MNTSDSIRRNRLHSTLTYPNEQETHRQSKFLRSCALADKMQTQKLLILDVITTQPKSRPFQRPLSPMNLRTTARQNFSRSVSRQTRKSPPKNSKFLSVLIVTTSQPKSRFVRRPLILRVNHCQNLARNFSYPTKRNLKNSKILSSFMTHIEFHFRQWYPSLLRSEYGVLNFILFASSQLWTNVYGNTGRHYIGVMLR